ncbi:nuclear pore membrane glycoprotein 210-like [Drosophila madeirensis]|uniref:Nuclear pore membrane glycoprotein 210-like n=1 Tax=Drosophila madeirensis TaxID=30013 RepID=A0AAU9F473_DROMD
MAASLMNFLMLICAAHKLIDAAKLNHARVLLPIFEEKSINFTLQVDQKICYKWTTSFQDLISVMPVYHGFSECANKAVVTVRARERRRNTAIVFAEEVHTGAVLRCDVIVDIIACLNVRTTTRQLYLEEAPAIFELLAFDSQGNEFSTLEGIEFNWDISEPDSKKPPPMRFLTFSRSPFHSVPPALEKFEAVGIKGYMILLEGINTGTSKITITLPYADYSNVKPLEVYISVLANIIIVPSKATILNKDSISFRILQRQMDKLHDITESKQYFLEVEDTEVASVRGSTATGETLGRTRILLRDRNMPETDKNTKGPSTLLTVAEPHKLGISLLPYNNWVSVEGEKHEVVFDLYAPDGQKVTLGNRFGIHSNLDKSLFGILNKTKNGSCLYGEALQKGVSTISGIYDQLAVEAKLQIFEKLQLRPSKVILPYDTNSIQPLKLQFYAAGGDYSYVWQSGNPQVLQIDAQGLATTVIRNVRLSTESQEQYDDGNLLAAHTTIKVALAKNQNIAQLAQVYFLSPQRLEIKQYNFETALKDYVLLHVSVYAHANDSEMPYTNCDNLHFQLDFSQPILQLENNWEAKKLATDACHVLRLRATAVGSTSLRVSYIFQDKVLQDTVDLHVFEALSVLNPLENELVLPIGASRNVIYVHGPRRLFTLEAELTKATNFNGKVVKVSEIELDAEDPITAFSILCRELGETVFQYRVYNSLATSKFVAFKSEVTTKVHCVMPRFLKLYSRQVLRQSCPLDHRSKLLYLKSQENNFEIEIEVQDAKNRRLMNVSSLWLDWEFAAGDERYHVDNIPHHQMSEVDLLHGVNVTSTEMLVLTLSEVSPNFRIKGTVVRYKDKMLAQQDIYAERPPFGVKNLKTGSITTPLIENEIRFHTVNSKLLKKDHISVYLAPNHRERIPIALGSGFFEMELSESGIVNVVHDEKAGILLVTPLRQGYTRLELTDRCLLNENSVLSISVVGIGSISVVSMDRVERTNSIEAIVKLFDTNDNLLDVDHNNLAVYDLSEAVFDPTILSVRLDEQRHLEPGHIRYSITGNTIGETKIVFQAGKGSQQVSSASILVQVFAPIRLYPRDFTLVLGSSIQIYYQGGPQPNSNVIYTVEKEQVASMSSAIVTAHRLGVTQITGKCLLKNPVTDKDEVVSQDTIEVRVAALKAVQIRTPLVRIRSGAVMPATLWGQPDFSPMVLGTLEDLRITWTVSQPDIVEIFNVFTALGIEYQSGDLISVRVRALNPGKVTIIASVSLADGTKLPATIVELIVFKTLELLGPTPIKMDSILAAPRSTLQLKSNMGDAVYKLDEQSRGIVSVTPDGIVQTKDTLGRDLIVAKTVDQNLPIGIEVKNVQYILVSLLPHMKFKKLEHKIPRGMNFLFKVSLHDNLGNEFSHNIEDANGLRYDLATKDVVDVQIDNNLKIALQRETNNMISISLKDTTGVKHAEDYIKLSVVESKTIYPTKTIFSVGDIICFDSPLTLSSIWSSSNEQIVTINKHTGIAHVLNHHHKLGEKIFITSGDEANRGGFIKYDLEVRESDAIVFAKSTDKFSGSEYRGQLVLRNHMQSEKRRNLIAHNVTKCAVQIDNVRVDVFTCRLVAKNALGRQLLKLYKAQPMFDAFSGQYSCRLELHSSFVELLAVVKTIDVLLELQAAMPNGVLDTMSLKLVPGIKVMPESVQVTDLKPQELHINGLDKALHKLQVKPSNSKYFLVDFLEHRHGINKYLLRFFEDFPMDEHFYVLIESPETEQIIEVPIAGSTMLAQKCADRPHGGPLFYRLVKNIGFLLSTTVIVVISIWVFQMQKSKNSPTASPNAFDNSPSIRRNYSHSSRWNHLDNSMDSDVYFSPRLSSANRSGNSPRFN